MALQFESEKCIGCKLCHLACSASKEEVFNPLLARLSVESYYKKGNLVIESRICTLCGKCADDCPTSAITMLEDRLSYDPESCINCGICVGVCPESVIIQKEEYIGLCDLCDGDPWCAKSCPHGALSCENILASKEGK